MKTSLLIVLVSFLATQAQAGDTGASLEALKAILNKYGAPKVSGTEKAGDKMVPGLYFGSRKINNNTDGVDEVKKRFGGTATVFVKVDAEFVRVTTNVLKEDGTRAVGTQLAHNKAYDTVTQEGKKFCGEVEILKSSYDTCYEPIKDTDGKTLGIYYVGFKK